MDAESPINDLTRLLWQQRRSLERVLYLLKVQDLVLASSDDAMLRHAVSDVQIALDTVAELETARQELTIELGLGMGIESNPSLEDLINRAPEPFDQMLKDHRDAFHTLVADITNMSINGQSRLERGLAVTRELSAFVLGDAGDGGYDASGATVRGSTERTLIDRAL